MTDNESTDEVVVTNGHVASVVRALQRDASALTPEMVGDEVMLIAATILAHMDELDKRSPHSVAMMLAIVDDNYDPQIRQWAKDNYDLADGEELRSANRQLERAMTCVKTRHKSWEVWKRRAGVASRVAA